MDKGIYGQKNKGERIEPLNCGWRKSKMGKRVVALQKVGR